MCSPIYSEGDSTEEVQYSIYRDHLSLVCTLFMTPLCEIFVSTLQSLILIEKDNSVLRTRIHVRYSYPITVK